MARRTIIRGIYYDLEWVALFSLQALETGNLAGDVVYVADHQHAQRPAQRLLAHPCGGEVYDAVQVAGGQSRQVLVRLGVDGLSILAHRGQVNLHTPSPTTVSRRPIRPDARHQ